MKRSDSEERVESSVEERRYLDLVSEQLKDSREEVKTYTKAYDQYFQYRQVSWELVKYRYIKEKLEGMPGSGGAAMEILTGKVAERKLQVLKEYQRLQRVQSVQIAAVESWNAEIEEASEEWTRAARERELARN